MKNAIRFEVNLPVSCHADALELWWDMTRVASLSRLRGQMSKTTISVNAYWSGRPRNCEAYALALSLQPKRPSLTDAALGI